MGQTPRGGGWAKGSLGQRLQDVFCINRHSGFVQYELRA